MAMKNYPYLIQRIRKRDPKWTRLEAKGVDKVFSFDYMGAAEFEWGAPVPEEKETDRDCSQSLCHDRTGESLH